MSGKHTKHAKDINHVTLNVAYVGQGGNAHQGQYMYGFTPNFLIVREKDVRIEYSLDRESAKRFEILSYAINDPWEQMTKVKLRDGVLSMTDRFSEHHKLINLCILVKDMQEQDEHGNDIVIDCDPQVTNVPPPEDPEGR